MLLTVCCLSLCVFCGAFFERGSRGFWGTGEGRRSLHVNPVRPNLDGLAVAASGGWAVSGGGAAAFVAGLGRLRGAEGRSDDGEVGRQLRMQKEE